MVSVEWSFWPPIPEKQFVEPAHGAASGHAFKDILEIGEGLEVVEFGGGGGDERANGGAAVPRHTGWELRELVLKPALYVVIRDGAGLPRASPCGSDLTSDRGLDCVKRGHGCRASAATCEAVACSTSQNLRLA